VLRGVIGAVPVCLVLTGCSSWFNQSKNVEITRGEVEQIRNDQEEVKDLLVDLRKRMERQEETLGTMRADLNLNQGEVSQLMDMLRVQLEDQGHRFDQIQRRVEASMTQPVPGPGVAGAGGVVGAFPAAGSISAAPESSAVPLGPPPARANDLYDAAYRDFSRGNYDLAIEGFRELLKYYPNMNLSDNAQYWIGECYYGLNKLDDALVEFLKVRDLFPDADKVPAATLKIGYTYLRKGDQEAAGRYFRIVVRDFPDSDEADLARDKLDSMH